MKPIKNEEQQNLFGGENNTAVKSSPSHLSIDMNQVFSAKIEAINDRLVSIKPIGEVISCKKT